MPDVTLRGVTLAAPCRAGAGRCRVIVPVTALLPQPAALQAQAAAAAGDIVELRLDALADQSHLGLVWAVQTVRRAAGQTPLLVTLRTAREGGQAALDPEAYAACWKRCAPKRPGRSICWMWNFRPGRAPAPAYWPRPTRPGPRPCSANIISTARPRPRPWPTP